MKRRLQSSILTLSATGTSFEIQVPSYLFDVFLSILLGVAAGEETHVGGLRISGGSA
jgi:hypothetical protein